MTSLLSKIIKNPLSNIFYIIETTGKCNWLTQIYWLEKFWLNELVKKVINDTLVKIIRIYWTNIPFPSPAVHALCHRSKSMQGSGSTVQTYFWFDYFQKTILINRLQNNDWTLEWPRHLIYIVIDWLYKSFFKFLPRADNTTGWLRKKIHRPSAAKRDKVGMDGVP